MDRFSPKILLHGNGYKALAATNGGDDSRLVTGESQGNAVLVGGSRSGTMTGLSATGLMLAIMTYALII